MKNKKPEQNRKKRRYNEKLQTQTKKVKQTNKQGDNNARNLSRTATQENEDNIGDRN